MSSTSEDMEYKTDHVISNDVGIQATPSQFNAEYTEIQFNRLKKTVNATYLFGR